MDSTPLLVGVAGGYVIVIFEDDCIDLIAFWQSKTWGDLRRDASVGFISDVDDRLREVIDSGQEITWPQDSDEFDQTLIPAVSDGDWPFPQQAMLDLIPVEIADRFGAVITTTYNGDLLAIDPETIDPFIAAMTEAGFGCVRDDRRVSLACGLS